jgi:hypothetical protein
MQLERISRSPTTMKSEIAGSLCHHGNKIGNRSRTPVGEVSFLLVVFRFTERFKVFRS